MVFISSFLCSSRQGACRITQQHWFIWFFLLVFVGMAWGRAAWAEKPPESKPAVAEVVPAIAETALGQNLKKLESYYQNLNQQLNDRMGGRTRDPFASPVGAPPRIPATVATKNTQKETDGSSRSATASPRSFMPGFGRTLILPVMQVRGFMQVNGQQAALLDIEGVGALVVRQGDLVGVSSLNQDEETVLRIVEVNRLNVVVTAGDLGEKWVVQ